ncbi:Fe-S-cluster containining protein [Streptomyces sp. V4I23]|uniref:YkgJ family cysteine cluster protein n=1 Tax=Streptomyces sp. V4I23 TaxID=3042282 RepID=UPI00277D6188|nr:YkgJ family cysteine cluster protein [Streptomyces sp. V4I23]MDQ1005939.1 Fe-S-cluster containining protein [Streptomyces sp. V4I23]
MNGSGANLAGCAGCVGDCCRNYKVGVTVSDMRRLAAGMSLNLREFTSLLEDEQDGFRLSRDGPTLDLHLRHRPVSRGCVFLMEIAQGKARCGAYAHRPLVCSKFPTTLERVSVIRGDTVCGPNSWNLAAMDLTSYQPDLTRNKAAWSEHIRIVRIWSATVEDPLSGSSTRSALRIPA